MTSTLDPDKLAAAWRGTEGQPTWELVVGDLLRLAALVSVVLAGIWFGAVGAVLFLLVLGGTMVPRLIGTRIALDATFCTTMIAAAWFALFESYRQVAWLDLVVHAVATGAIAMLVHQVLVLAEIVTPARRARSSTVVAVVGLGSFVAVLWELMEAIGYVWVDRSIYVNYTDTIGDLAAALVGSAVAAALVARNVRGDR